MSKKSFSSYAHVLVSNNLVRKTSQWLGVSTLGKRIYFALFAPRNKKVSHTLGGINAQFYVNNYSEFIYLTESVVGVGDERTTIAKVIKEIKPRDVIYDVGAFLGFHTIFFAKSVTQGKVIAFEPSLSSYQATKKNVALNNLANVEVVDVALGDRVEEKILKGNDSSMYSLSDKFDKVVFNQKLTVMPGDLVVQERRLPLPNIVKIDVEGYEYLVIKGLESTLKNPDCRFVCCEIHPTLLPAGTTSDMVIALLKSLGFTKIETEGRQDTFHAFCYK